MMEYILLTGLVIVSIQVLFLTRKFEKLMTHEEALDLVASIKAQNEKAKVEITGKISDLEAKLAAAGAIPDDVAAALEDLKTSVQGTDDIVPDAPATPAPDTSTEAVG